MIFFALDYVIEKTLKQNQTAEQIFLRKFTGARISAAEARRLFERINDHKWYVSERLGRDVGMTVAAVDYLQNIYEGGSDMSDLRRRRRRINMQVFENLTLTV